VFDQTKKAVVRIFEQEKIFFEQKVEKALDLPP